MTKYHDIMLYLAINTFFMTTNFVILFVILVDVLHDDLHILVRRYTQWPKYSKHNIYHEVSNIRRTLVRNWIVDHSDIVGASPVGAAPTISSFST